jgi:tetratricopeptide (TPR) repeat protein
VQFAFGSGRPATAAADAAAYRAAAEDTAFRHHYEEVMVPAAARSFATLAALAGARSGNGMADGFCFGFPFFFVMGLQRPPLDVDELGPAFIGPSAPLVLAVRSARRAILENPQDADGYFQLGLAYLALSRQSDEHRFGGRMPLLEELRQVQTIASLRTAAVLNPDHAGAHFYLQLLYGRAGYADLQLKHLDAEIKAIRLAAPRSAAELQAFKNRNSLGYQQRANPAQAAEAMKLFEDYLKAKDEEKTKLEKAVKDNQNTYAVRSEKKRVLEKARIALDLGLGEKALQVLLDSDSLEFGKDGAQMELTLLMHMGRLDELREQLAPEKDEKIRKELPEDMNSTLGQGAYETYRMLLAVAEGDYKTADDSLEQAGKKALANPKLLQALRVEVTRPSVLMGFPLAAAQMRKEEGSVMDLTFSQLAAMQVAKMIAERPPEPGPAVWLLVEELARMKRSVSLSQLGSPLAGAADFETLRGLLKVETGDIDGAKAHFRKALFADEKQKKLDAPVAHDSPGLLIAYHYLRAIEKKD